MGFYVQCFVADITFNKQDTPMALIKTYLFQKDNFFTWQFDDNWKNTEQSKGYTEVGYGLLVNEKYVQVNNGPAEYLVKAKTLRSVDEYEFSYKLGTIFEKTIFHVILPKGCILTEECDVLLRQNLYYTIMLRNERECITVELEGPKTHEIKLTFLKVSHDTYRRKHQEA